MNITSIVVMMIAIIVVTSHSAHALHLSRRALQDEVFNLPGAPTNLPFRHFAGYIDVEDDVGKASIFYWLVTSIKVAPETAPLTWWTNGGPGCSGLTGNLTSNGPFKLRKDGIIELRDFPWNDYSNVVFVEQPDVGFTRIQKHTGGFWTDDMVAERNAVFIERFFERFTQFKSNPFYIASQSYGGHYLPTLSNVLIRRQNELNIDYRGLFVGNPLLYQRFRDYGFFQTLIGRQLIPFYPYGQQFIEKCAPDVNAPHVNPPIPPPAECWEIEMKMRSYIRNIDPYALSFPICVDVDSGVITSSLHGDQDEQQHLAKYLFNASREYRGIMPDDDMLFDQNEDKTPLDLTMRNTRVNDQVESIGGYFPSEYEPCARIALTHYLNRPDVQKALHVMEGSSRWTGCKDINYSSRSINQSMIEPLKESHRQSNGHVKALLYSGNDDGICSTVEAQMALFNSNLTMHTHPWRDVVVNGQLIGHRTDFDELSFVTVNGAGHVGSATRPEQVYSLFNAFITEQWGI